MEKWQEELSKNITTIEELEKHIKLSGEEKSSLEEVIGLHPMSITRYYLGLIDPDNPDDPIRRQIVPSESELDERGSFDTSGESENTKSVGLQHKYAQTALILSTNRCAAYCRFCFRKRLVGLTNEEILKRFDEAASYIKEHKEINNVLISGGDPFTLPTETIRKFLEMLSPIEHLDFIRFGTRTPVTFPYRILWDKKLPELFREFSEKKRIYVVTHFNHPKEITEESKGAIRMLSDAGIVVSNQTVLMRKVNDNPDTIAKLMNGLTRIGVVPYYVFQCRPVKRVMHFPVTFEEGLQILDEARKMMNGHAKRFKYMMSHKTGKIEILGIKDGEIFFKQHHAKDPSMAGRFFSRKLKEGARWLDDLE